MFLCASLVFCKFNVAVREPEVVRAQFALLVSLEPVNTIAEELLGNK